MRNRTSGRRRSAAEWSKLVAAWKRTGKSASEFATPRGIVPNTLAWWRWHLARQSKQSGSALETAVRRRTVRKRSARRVESRPGPRLVAVEVSPELEERDRSHHVAWEVESTRGCVLRVRTSISSPELERVLAVMTAEDSTR